METTNPTDTELLEFLQEELAVHEGGMNGVFKIGYDDATFQVYAEKTKHYKGRGITGYCSGSIRGALIDLMKGIEEERENRNAETIS